MDKKNPNIYQRALDIVNNRINPDIPQGGGGGGIPEAPIDGKQYARKNGAWSEVQDSEFTVVIDYDNIGSDTQAAYDEALAAFQAKKNVLFKKGDISIPMTGYDSEHCFFGGTVSAYLPGNIINAVYAHVGPNGNKFWWNYTIPLGANALSIADEDEHFTGTNVESALAELASSLDGKQSIGDFVDIPYADLGATPYTYSEIVAGHDNGKKYRVLAPHNSDTIICPLQSIAVNAHTTLIIFGSGIASIDMSVGKFDYEVVTLHSDNTKNNYHNYAPINALGCPIADSGNYYTSTNVEGALAEIGAELSGINTLIGSGVIT